MECPWEEEDLGGGFLGFCCFDDGGYCFEVVLCDVLGSCWGL